MSLSVLGSGLFFLLTALCLVLAERYRGQQIARTAAKGAMGCVVIAGVLLASDVPILGALMDPSPHHAKKKKSAGGGGGDVSGSSEAGPADSGGASQGAGANDAAGASGGAASGGEGQASSPGEPSPGDAPAAAMISSAAAAGVAAAVQEKAAKIAEEAACNELPEMVRISPGIGRIGAPADDAEAALVEKPEREARIWPGFAISRNEITFQQYKCFADATHRSWSRCTGMPVPRKTARLASPDDAESPHVPATCLSWEDANAYAGWLSRRTGRIFRLPSALEWEYAARAGERLVQAGLETDEPRARARIVSNMGGGVAEFVADCWINRKKDADGKQDDIDQAAQPKLCPTHVLKDGADSEDAHTRKVWSRRRALAGITSATIGFRVVRNN